MGATRPKPLSELAFEDSVVSTLAVSPMYTARDACHFDAVTLLDAEQLWNFPEGDLQNRRNEE